MKKKKKEEGGSDWMATYGDMVTLLLCFFVLLYSMSSIDQQKWIAVVKSFNPDAGESSQVVTDQDAEGESMENVPGSVQEQINEDFEELYLSLLNYKEQVKDTTEVVIESGDGEIFITFKDKLFFDGDSYVLREEGKQILDSFSSVIQKAEPAIEELQVLGHTTQAVPHEVNEITSDRVLAATRSAVVVAYLEQKQIISGAKMTSLGYGQFHPVATFDTEEGRAQNRRVEVRITKIGGDNISLEELYGSVEEGGSVNPQKEEAAE